MGTAATARVRRGGTVPRGSGSLAEAVVGYVRLGWTREALRRVRTARCARRCGRRRGHDADRSAGLTHPEPGPQFPDQLR